MASTSRRGDGIVALTEVVIHGWDVAVATGQDYDVDPATLRAVLAHVSRSIAAEAGRGPVRARGAVADDAPALDRVIALSGRDPACAARKRAHWSHGPGTALRQIAYYKDRAREDSRRVMAYRNAADVVEALTDAQRERHGAANSWQSLPGIGPKTAKVIAQAWAGREPDALVELRSSRQRSRRRGDPRRAARRPARALELVGRLRADRGDDARPPAISDTSTAR